MKIPNENELVDFFGSYFHQDWDLEAQDWRGVVREFAENESESYVSAVLGGLEVIARSGLDSGDLEDLLSQRLGCGNNPNWGEPLSEWFSDLASELQVALAGRASQS